MPLLDTVLLLAAVVEIGPSIEAHRQPPEEHRAFSYRFALDGNGAIFSPDRTFRAWLQAQLALVKANLKIRNIISTDISDFYARVNYHRLENLLAEVAPKHGAARYILKHIKVIRAKQSFGVPVGGSAARLLAELALADTDLAIRQEGLLSTRFVDDFRIFLQAHEDPYDALALLAEQLGLSEGLSLNAAKTKVETRAEFLARLRHLVADVAEEAEGAALEALTSDIYFDDEPDAADLEALKSMNLLGFLQEEVGEEAFDMGRIKVIFRALTLAKPSEAVEYIRDNFTELVVFAKEMTILMQALQNDNRGCFADLTETVIDTILSPPSSSIQTIKTWLMELFVRGVVPIDASGVKRLETLSSPLDRRQLHLIRGRIRDRLYFRRGKTGFGQLSDMEQSCFVWGASCLPKDEFESWLTMAKSIFARPLGALYLKWAEQQRGKLFAKLETPTDDHQE
nr:reverse transcriptase domain-containing protein [Neoroseomonas terrae]